MTGDALLYWGLALLVISLLLLGLEAFVPSGGLLGAMAVASALAGVVLLFRVSAWWGASGLASVLLLGPVVFFWAVSTLPTTPFGRKLVNAPSEDEVAAQELAEVERRRDRASLVGVEGVCLVDLHPVGEIEIADTSTGGVRLEVLAEHGWIDAGSRVRITRVEGMEIYVRPVA